MVLKLLGVMGHQWKGVMALSAAMLVGASGGSYMTLPRAVGNLQSRLGVVEQRLDRIEMQTGLSACLNLAEFEDDAAARAALMNQCVVTWISPDDRDDP